MRNFEILQAPVSRDNASSNAANAETAANAEAEAVAAAVEANNAIAAADAAIANARSYTDRVKAIVAREKLGGARLIKSVTINCSVSDDVISRITFSLEDRFKVITNDGDSFRSVFSQSSYGVFDVLRHKALFQGIIKDLESAPKLLSRILSGCTITAMLKDVSAGEVSKNPFSEKQQNYTSENSSTWFFLLDVVPNERAKVLIDKIYFGEVDLSRFARPTSPVAAPATASEDVPF